MSCVSPTFCIYIDDLSYNVYNTTYYSAGTYNGNLYYTGQSNGYYIYYSSANTQWCLSALGLGGVCQFFGKSPCISNCPDLCEDFFFSGVCPTTTTTTTINCSVLDFSAIFDCDVFPTTTTTTSTSTTTTTTLPPPNPCSGTSIDAVINAYTTTTTTIPSTTTTTTTLSYNCEFSGSVIFDILNIEMKCPVTKEFKNCFNNGIRYYTSDTLINPSGNTIDVDMVFTSVVDGVETCISYVGLNYDNSSINSISLIDFIGFYPSACTICLTSTTTTSTSTTTTTTLPPPDCYCYVLANAKPTIFSYVDCSGNTSTISPQINSYEFVCSRTLPINTGGQPGSITQSYLCTGGTLNCILPECYCYKVENKNAIQGAQFMYIDCENIIRNVNMPQNSILFVCSKIVPFTTTTNPNLVVSGGNILCVNGECLV